MKVPGVAAVVTGKDLEKYNLHWMPTLMSDTQMVLPTDTVMYQSQEVAAVIATSRYAARDGREAVKVEYEPMKPVINAHKAMDASAPVLRTDKPDKKDNHIWHWEVGDKQKTEDVFNKAEVIVKQDMYIPRIHVASIETCGCVADYDKVNNHLTMYMTTQAPHAIRTVIALVAGHVGLTEEKIRVVSPDIGGGFGGKVPVYPGYVIAIAVSFLTGAPVKWIEDRDVYKRQVYALEEGYKKLSAEVLIRIESNKNINTAESWESVMHMGYHMEKLQNKIKPLLPLVSENGHRARFTFIGTAEIISEAKKAAAALHHTRVIGLTNEAYEMCIRDRL